MGTAISHQGTTLFVVNTDAKTVNTALDPWAVVRGDAGATAHANQRPIAVPQSYLYLDLHVMVEPSTETISDGPTLVVAGLVPSADKRRKDRAWPEDENTGDPPFPWREVGDFGEGMWVPLADKDGATTLTMGNAAILNYSNPDFYASSSSSSGPETFWIGAPSTVYLAGVKKIIVFVSGAATLAGSGSALIVGRFVG